MPPIDLPPLPPNLVDWAQVLGTGFGFFAILVAFFALWRQRRYEIRDQRYMNDIQALERLQLMLEEVWDTRIRADLHQRVDGDRWTKLKDVGIDSIFRLRNRTANTLIGDELSRLSDPPTYKQIAALLRVVETELHVIRMRHLR